MDDKIFDLLRIYNESKFIFPYWTDDLLSKWEIECHKILTKIISGQLENDRDYYLQLMEFTNLLEDGHTYFRPYSKIYEDYPTYPIELQIFDEKLVISKSSVKYEKFLNIEIESINGYKTNDFLDTYVKKYFWSSKINFTLREFGNLAGMIVSKSLDIKFENGENVIINASIDNYKLTNEKSYYENMKEIVKEDGIEIYEKENKIFLVLKHFMSESIVPNFYDSLDLLQKSDEIIFDIRNNIGCNSGYANQIAQAFFERKFETELSGRQVIDMQSFANGSQGSTEIRDIETYNHQYLENYIDNDYYMEYKGLLIEKKVSILQNNITFSSAENFAMIFKNKGRARIIGEYSAESTGQPTWIPINEKSYFQITAKKVLLPDGTVHHNIGVAPDIEIVESLSAKKNGYDEMIEYVL